MATIAFAIWAFSVVGVIVMELSLVLSARHELRLMREAGEFTRVIKKPFNLGSWIRFIFMVICPVINTLMMVGMIVNFDELLDLALDNVELE